MGKRVKVAVTGAAGQIGYSLLFRIASGEAFGADTAIELQLIELEAALPRLAGTIMELEDCAFPLVEKISMTSDLHQGFSGVNWALLVGSVPRKKGMERKDLLQINGKIFVEQGRAIQKNAANDVRTLVVGNPCNTNCLIAMSNAPDIPKEQWFALTALDENRAKSQLAAKAGVLSREVTNVTIWGNHSATQYPDFYNAKINGSPVTDVIDDHQWLQGEFIANVQKRGAAIIEARGASSAASAANGVIDNINNILTPTRAGDWFSAAIPSDGSYGVEEGLLFGYPLRSDGSTVEIVEGIELNEFGQEKFTITHNELKEEKEAVKDSLAVVY